MSGARHELNARAVLSCYPVLRNGRAIRLGNLGGFSGASLWRVETSSGNFCLRAWPPSDPDRERLHWIHRLMTAARAAGLLFVPALLPVREGVTHVEHADRLWDATSWLAGCADFHKRPTTTRLTAACTALARLHAAWVSLEFRVGPCPAVARRLERVRQWQQLVRSGWRPTLDASTDPVAPWAARAWTALQEQVGRIPRVLAPWVDQALPLSPCLCDVWSDHVLFEGDALTGLVDYGSVKVDHAAVDLARMLGSLVGDDAAQRHHGLAAYSTIRPLTPQEQSLVGVLDETGTLLGAANWLRWLYRDGRHYENRDAVARRLAALVQRLERWP
ncbi:MAG: phosphotransferase [Gemmataceae bacterium]|nr:phosphotransferase [Gemmataceae bacterium]